MLKHSIRQLITEALQPGPLVVDLSRRLARFQEGITYLGEPPSAGHLSTEKIYEDAHKTIRTLIHKERWRPLSLTAQRSPTSQRVPPEKWFDDAKWMNRVKQFVSEWSDGRDSFLAKEIERFPTYFLQHLSFYSEKNALLTKAILIRFELVPADASVVSDAEVSTALSQKSSVQIPPGDLQKISEWIIGYYECLGAAYFPEKFKKLTPEEKEVWRGKIFDLPPLFVRMLEDSDLGHAQFLLMAQKLELSTLGIPESSDVPVHEG